MLRKARRNDSSLNETEFLKKLEGCWNETKQDVTKYLLKSLNFMQILNWERGLSKKIEEKSRFEKVIREDKQSNIERILSDDIMISLEELDKRITERGFPGQQYFLNS